MLSPFNLLFWIDTIVSQWVTNRTPPKSETLCEKFPEGVVINMKFFGTFKRWDNWSTNSGPNCPCTAMESILNLGYA